MLTTAWLTGIMGFLITILFLFCIPDLDTLFALNSSQPFVQVYALALGRGPSVFMTIVAVIGLIMVNPFPNLSAPRLTPPCPFAVYFHHNCRCLPVNLCCGP